MTQPAYTTRDQAESLRGLDPDMIEIMAERAYEAGKSRTSTLPPWKRVEPTYQAAIRREIATAVRAGIDAGYLTIVPRS